VFPHLLGGDAAGVLARATIAQGGQLRPDYAYLSDYVG
jgi:saccharopine dehydrogenase (NAD+, L-lysine-forming)